MLLWQPYCYGNCVTISTYYYGNHVTMECNYSNHVTIGNQVTMATTWPVTLVTGTTIVTSCPSSLRSC